MKAIGNNGWPDKVVIDKSGSNTAALFNMNCLLVMCGWGGVSKLVEILWRRLRACDGWPGQAARSRAIGAIG
jgi:transposase-like protein